MTPEQLQLQNWATLFPVLAWILLDNTQMILSADQSPPEPYQRMSTTEEHNNLLQDMFTQSAVMYIES